jgi:hypothetical protein
MGTRRRRNSNGPAFDIGLKPFAIAKPAAQFAAGWRVNPTDRLQTVRAFGPVALGIRRVN